MLSAKEEAIQIIKELDDDYSLEDIQCLLLILCHSVVILKTYYPKSGIKRLTFFSTFTIPSRYFSAS